MKKLKDLYFTERPREKLKAKGAQVLSDFELLQALIGSGNKQASVGEIAKNVQRLFTAHGADVSYNELEQIKGLGSAMIAMAERCK